MFYLFILIFKNTDIYEILKFVPAKLLQLCPTLGDPMDSSSPGSSIHGHSPGKNTGVGCRELLQGILPTQRSSPVLLHVLHWLGDSLPLAPPGSSVPFSLSVMSTLWDTMDYSTPDLPVHHQFPQLAQTHVHWVGDAIQPSHPLSSPSPLALNLA